MIPEPPLFVLWYDFSKWLLDKTEKFPRKVRFTFSNRIANTALDVMEGIIEARYSREKTGYASPYRSRYGKIAALASHVP